MTTTPDTPTSPTRHQAHDTLLPLLEPLADLKPYSRNPRRGDTAAIAESLLSNGQYKPIVANRRTGEVLAGNHTLAAAAELGWTHLAVSWVDVDDDTAARIVLVDNRSNDLASYDDAELIALLESLPDLAGTGYDADAIADLLADAADVPPSLTDPDDVPDTPTVALSAPGTVWVLGKHRLVCGDATDPDVWALLLGGDKVHAIWTDPPYGVDYEGKTKNALKIENDGTDLGDLARLLRGAFEIALTFCRPGAAWYVAAPAGPATLPFAQVLTDLSIWRQTLVWVKNTFALGHSDYHYRHEVIYAGYGPKGAGRRGRGGAGWYGPNNADSVFEVDKPSRNAVHPTMKPVDLICRALGNSTRPGHMVADPFGGSGSTLIACQEMGRVARVIELDARYVDVICRRFQEHTGTLPILEESGEPVDFTAVLG